MDEAACILVVDDEPDLLANIELALTLEGYRVIVAATGSSALRILESEPVHLILADIAMADMNGYQLYERIRANPQWITIPFIFLSARALDSDVRYGKELGADDYLTKPIRIADLLAVVRGKLRRAQELNKTLAQLGPANSKDKGLTLNVGPLRIDLEQHRAWQDGQEIDLSAKEFVLLSYLAQQAGRVSSPQELIRVTHELETDHVEAGALLRPLVLSLRRKMGLPVGQAGSVENVRGVGYRLVISD